jgi:hypothetical protein
MYTASERISSQVNNLESKLELALAMLKNPDTRLAAWHLNLAETLVEIKREIEKLGL